MGDHYFDGNTFTNLLKETSGSTSIIYRYDENYSPLSAVDSIYHTTTDLSNIRFHNQIFSIDMSGNEKKYITQVSGKDVDVTLDITLDTLVKTGDTSTVNIKNVPFIGNYSEQEVLGVPNTKVLDLFEYRPKQYTISVVSGTDTNSPYTVTYDDMNYHNLAKDDTFSYDIKEGKWYISDGDGIGNGCFYSTPVGITTSYDYTRIKSYNYPTTNVNNIVANQGIEYLSPKIIANDLNLPNLP